jgi:hypothetical protein
MHASLRLALPGLMAAVAAAVFSAGVSAQSATSVQASCPNSGGYNYPGAYGYGGVYGYASTTGQTSCQVTEQGQPLYSGSVIFVGSAAANGASPSECDGVTAPDYTTQNFGNTPLSLNTWFSGPAGCAFTVTSGTVQPGDQLGTEQLSNGSIPTGGGTISLNALVCTDPSCGGLSSAPGYSVAPYQSNCSSYYAPGYNSYQPSCPYTSYQPATPSYAYVAPPPPPPPFAYTSVTPTFSSGCFDADCDGDSSGQHHHHHDH